MNVADIAVHASAVCTCTNEVCKGMRYEVCKGVISMKTSLIACDHSSTDVQTPPKPLPEDSVKSIKSVSGKAVEKWCIFHLLPLYIGKLVA